MPWGKAKEAKIQNNKLQEELDHQKVLMAKCKHESDGQAQLINDILKEYAKEKVGKECQAKFYQELKGNVNKLERMATQGKQELLQELKYAL